MGQGVAGQGIAHGDTSASVFDETLVQFAAEVRYVVV